MRTTLVRLLATAALVVACTSSPPAARGVVRGATANEAWRRGDLAAGLAEYADALHEDLLDSDEAAAVRHVNNAAVLDAHAGRDREADDAFAAALARCSGPGAETERRRLVLQRAALRLRRGGLPDVTAAGAALLDAPLRAWAETAAPADRVQYWSLVSGYFLRSRAAGSEALVAAQRALDAADSAETRAVAALSVGRVHEAAGSPDLARSAYETASDEAGRASHPWLRLAALRGMSRACATAQERERHARLADDLAAELDARAGGGSAR